jgi:3,4-dehydroadipyl-CoA semialdehyde dehydrogenase
MAAGLLPDGSLSLLCGSAGDLLAHLTSDDVIAFTGSHETARQIRRHRNVTEQNVPVNIEADSVNAAILAPDAAPGSPAFDAFIREVVREMTAKEKLKRIVVGDPRRDEVRMGPVVTRAQQAAVLKGIEQLASECQVLCGGPNPPALDGTEPSKSAFVSPTLLRALDPGTAKLVHEVEVFGPAATLLSFDDADQAFALARRGGGSLVASIFGADLNFLARAARELGSAHGRILAVDPSVATSHTGHGIVMPQCKHGGPGRAGSGEELGGLHGLRFYHQRVAIQGSTDVLPLLQREAASLH